MVDETGLDKTKVDEMAVDELGPHPFNGGSVIWHFKHTM